MPKLIVISLLCGLFATSVESADSLKYQMPQINLSYWNDNFGLQSQLKDVITPGDDDNMTASWRLEVGLGDQTVWHGLELYYAIFTNREENYRFDLLAGRYSKVLTRGPFIFKLGAGMIFRGDFGGGWLQNSFHESQGYEPVDLAYLEQSRVGGLFYSRIAYNLIHIEDNFIQVYNSSALRVGAGPTNLRAGLEAGKSFSCKHLPVRGSITLRGGYAHYLRSSDVMKPHFKYGPVAGIQAGIVIRDQFGLALWFTENQYGLEDPHYGITMSYRKQGLVLPKLHSVMFP